MTNPNGLFKKLRFRMSALLGILFLVIGVSLLGYSVFTVQDYEQLQNNTEMTLEQMWHYDGSLTCWTNAYFTLFLLLLSVFMTLSGVILVIHSLLERLRHKSVD
jgi:hypothetical protein